MRYFYAGLIAALAVGFTTSAFAQEAAQVARAVSPLTLAQYDNGGRRGDTIECGSRGYKLARCRVPWRDARLVRQTSDSSCVRDRTWGFDRGGIWVDKGCGGTFAEARRGDRPDYGNGGDRPDYGNGGDWRPGPGFDTSIRVRCASQGYHYNMCQVDTGRGSSVRVERQISNTRCEQGRTWGFNRAGIWVDGGCEAIFRIDRRWR
ncbi:MAG: DUF3011 domain-containing protein [Dokdonella sp.]